MSQEFQTQITSYLYIMATVIGSGMIGVFFFGWVMLVAFGKKAHPKQPIKKWDADTH